MQEAPRRGSRERDSRPRFEYSSSSLAAFRFAGLGTGGEFRITTPHGLEDGTSTISVGVHLHAGAFGASSLEHLAVVDGRRRDPHDVPT